MYHRPRERSGREPHPKEEYAYILDYLPRGNPLDRHEPHRSKPVAQALGDRFFTLLELHPRPFMPVEIGERVYIGRGLRDKIAHVFGRIDYEDLTSVARGNLPPTVSRIIQEREKVFVGFFNLAGSVTLKLHVLELLPGIGKKTLKILLAERERRPFESFDDIRTRGRIPNPVSILTERILAELRGEEKYYLFVRPPPHRSGVYFGFLDKLYEQLGGFD